MTNKRLVWIQLLFTKLSLRHAAEIISDNPAALQVSPHEKIIFEGQLPLPAAISSNSEYDLCREQQHNHLPRPRRHHVQPGQQQQGIPGKLGDALVEAEAEVSDIRATWIS